MMHILRTYPQNGAYPHGMSSAVIGEAANEDCDQANPKNPMDGRRGCEFGMRGFGFRVSGFGFQVSGFGFRVSGFEIRDSGFGFRVSGLVFRA